MSRPPRTVDTPTGALHFMLPCAAVDPEPCQHPSEAIKADQTAGRVNVTCLRCGAMTGWTTLEEIEAGRGRIPWRSPSPP